MRIEEVEQAFNEWLVAAQTDTVCEHLYARITHLFCECKMNRIGNENEMIHLGAKLYREADRNPKLTQAILNIMGAFRVA